MKNKLTIHELAEKAKISVATISRALNPETRWKVAPETCELVDRLAKKYNYSPNQAARHLRQTSYRTLGIVFAHHEGIFLSDYYSQVLSGITDCLLHSDYAVKMILLKPREAKWDNYDFKDGECVDGLILTYWRTFFSDASVLAKLNIPCVVISNAEENVKAHFVGGDHYAGGRLAAEHLYNSGHREIAVLTGSNGAPDASQRLAGFRSFLKEKKVRLKSSAIFDVHFSETEAYEITPVVLARNPEVTAIFCLNDTLALGVLKKMKELGVHCPRKISVMGYDNDRRSETSLPPLTTVQVPVYEAAKKGAERLLQFLKDKDAQKFYEREFLPVSLVPRESVGKVR